MKEQIDAIVASIPDMTNPELIRLITPLIQEAVQRGGELLKAIPHNATQAERANILALATIANQFKSNN